MRLPLVLQGVSKVLYNSIPNVAVWRGLRKSSHFKAYKLFVVHDVAGADKEVRKEFCMKCFIA
jgi:hypothetical protein